MSQDSTINDVIEAVQALSTHMDAKFVEINAKMVTKDYLDDKLADLRGDLVVLTRKEDHKVRELIGILQKKNVLNDEEVQHLLKLEPFPILSL